MNTTPETLVVEQADFAAAQEWINTPCSAAEEVLASATDSMDMQGRQMTLAFMAGAQHARLATLSSKGRGEDAELERLICAIIEDAPSASDEEGHFHGGAYLPAARQILASLDPTPEPCSPVAREGEEAECPFVAGPACNDGECWTAEVQIVGGHYVVATVHGATEQEARERQAAIINALAQTPPALSGGGELRPEVLAFAHLMEAQLRANDHKPGWKDDGPMPLLRRAREEARELFSAILDFEYGPTPARTELVGKEAADVANFAMMVADVCGALGALAQSTPAVGEGL